MSTAQDWGTPDWLIPEAYHFPPEPHEMAVWAWEFLRRNPIFRDFWLTKMAPYFAFDDRTIGRLRLLDENMLWPGEYYDEMRDKFGIYDPRSPQDNAPPVWVDHVLTYSRAAAVSYQRLQSRLSSGAEPTPTTRRLLEIWNKDFETRTIRQYRFETIVRIDVRLPIKNQLDRIQRLVESDQQLLREAGELTDKKPRNRHNYVEYLRLLDAVDSGANRLVIEEKLFPRINSSYEQGDPRAKKYDNSLRAAKRLRDQDYRALAAASL